MITLLTGDCLQVLPTLPGNSVNCCVTSPPYWGLRDYGVDGQIGLELTVDAYLDKMIAVFREVRRVLCEDGTLWLNLGDSYASGGRTEYDPDPKLPQRGGKHRNRSSIGGACKAKDLIGIPWRVALALQADGWYLRQDIIWHKPNPMPESVTDRCTKAHEYVFLLSKSARYYYDAEAIKEPTQQVSLKVPAGWDTATGAHGTIHREGRTPASHHGSRFDKGKTARHQLDRTQQGERIHGNKPGRSDEGKACNVPGQERRNKRSVWTVATFPCKAAHFATFPPALVRPMILAGCPVGGTVLDPFGGTGTTAEVAEVEGRNSILIELNPAYVPLINKRTSQGGLFCGKGAV